MGSISGIVYDDAGAAVDGRVVRLYNRATGALVGETESGPRLGGVEPTTWNPADKGSGVTLSGGDLTANTSHFNYSVRSVFGASSGKWYWEYTVDGLGTPGWIMAGIGNASAPVSSGGNAYPGSNANSWCYFAYDGTKYHNASATAYGTSLTTGNVLSVLLDMDAGTLTFWEDGADLGTAFTGITGTIYAMFGSGASAACQITANFGQSAFAYSPPSGYLPGLGVPVPAVEDDGGYLFDPVSAGTYTVLFLDDEAGTQHNALVRDRVVVA